MGLVWAYCGWAVNRPNGSIEESLHIALALAVSGLPCGDMLRHLLLLTRPSAGASARRLGVWRLRRLLAVWKHGADTCLAAALRTLRGDGAGGPPQITAAFFIYFVIDGVVTENVFELTAALVLDALVLARVLFYVIVKKKTRFPGRIVLLSFITAFQLIVLVSDCCP